MAPAAAITPLDASSFIACMARISAPFVAPKWPNVTAPDARPMTA
jgi:hypothetical protein